MTSAEISVAHLDNAITELDKLPTHTILQELNQDPAMGNEPHPWVKGYDGSWRCACDDNGALKFSSAEVVEDAIYKRLIVVWTP